MSLRFYFDQHVPGPIVRGLRARGIDCLTADEDGRRDLEDEPLLARATELGRVLVTMDSDFYGITAERQRGGLEFAGVIFAHPFHVTYGQAIEDIKLLSAASEPADVVNQFIHLPL